MHVELNKHGDHHLLTIILYGCSSYFEWWVGNFAGRYLWSFVRHRCINLHHLVSTKVYNMRSVLRHDWQVQDMIHQIRANLRTFKILNTPTSSILTRVVGVTKTTSLPTVFSHWMVGVGAPSTRHTNVTSSSSLRDTVVIDVKSSLITGSGCEGECRKANVSRGFLVKQAAK